jgi:hypothetical protein
MPYQGLAGGKRDRGATKQQAVIHRSISYPEEQQVYNEPFQVTIPSTSRTIADLRTQMELDERSRFDALVEAQQQKLIDIARLHVELQAFPIGNPDPIPKPKFPKKKGKTDAPGLSGFEIAALELKAREELARRGAAVVSDTGESDDEGILVPRTPPRPVTESQGGTAMTLIVRLSPEQVRRVPPTSPVPAASLFFRLFPEEPPLPPASTAPARLEEEGRGKRRRIHNGKYEISKAQGGIGESQHGK